MNKISDRINSLPKEDKQLLDSLIQVKELKKGQLIFDDNANDNSVYYVVDGLLRKYILKDGNEKTLDFYFSDDLYFPAVLQQDKKTNSFLQAIDKTTVYKIDNFKFEKLKASNIKLLELENLILEIAYTQTTERLQNFQTMNATERYTNLLDRNPKIVQQISLTYIASYLGINNASLSKIRANLK